jgi:hypothetical protein
LIIMYHIRVEVYLRRIIHRSTLPFRSLLLVYRRVDSEWPWSLYGGVSNRTSKDPLLYIADKVYCAVGTVHS